MLARNRFEVEYGIIFDKYNYGSTIWSPLMGGILTGKYCKEVPDQGRYSKILINKFSFFNLGFYCLIILNSRKD